jgi:hypothetical protein
VRSFSFPLLRTFYTTISCFLYIKYLDIKKNYAYVKEGGDQILVTPDLLVRERCQQMQRTLFYLSEIQIVFFSHNFKRTASLNEKLQYIFGFIDFYLVKIGRDSKGSIIQAYSP